MHNINNKNNNVEPSWTGHSVDQFCNNKVILQSTTKTATAAATRINTTQACASCKYQRRKCAPDCILAPYFPHDRQRQFLNAHKLFGVSNITKIIRHLDQTEKDTAMRTIIFQSDVRATDPVGGCYRIIRQLQRQIDYTKAELEFVLHQLALCRAAAQAQAQFQNQQVLTIVPDDDYCGDSSPAKNSDVNNIFGMESLGLESSNHGLVSGETTNYQPHFQHNNHNNHHLELQQYMMMINDQNNDDANAGASTALQEAVTTAKSWGVGMPSSTTEEQQQHSNDVIQERNDNSVVFKPLLFDCLSDDPDQDFRFESEPTIEQSDEQTTLKIDKVSFKAEDEGSFHCSVAGEHHHHDLKGAATLFTLTKCHT